MTRVNANPSQKLTRITQLHDLPVCITLDGMVVVPIQWDYVTWTPLADRFVRALKAQDFGAKLRGYAVVFTGVASPMAADALKARGVTCMEKQLPGPLQ